MEAEPKTAKQEHAARKRERKLNVAAALKDAIESSTVGIALMPVAQILGAQLVDDIECGAEGVIVDSTFSSVQKRLDTIARLLA